MGHYNITLFNVCNTLPFDLYFSSTQVLNYIGSPNIVYCIDRVNMHFSIQLFVFGLFFFLISFPPFLFFLMKMIYVINPYPAGSESDLLLSPVYIQTSLHVRKV